MKVIDRLTGETLELPSPVTPGRYAVRQACRFNGHSDLEPHAVLVGDGSSRCVLDDKPAGHFPDTAQPRERRAKVELLREAIHAIHHQRQDSADALPSPLMPLTLARVLDLGPLEEELAAVMQAGHLDEIARRPRMSLNYETELTVLSRARRLAPDAHRRLASNSGDWQYRTFSGIVPRRVLALHSEDDLGLYENKVFARLVDRLVEHLLARIAKINHLHRNLEDAMRLQDAEHLFRPLREELCSLWGEAFLAADSNTAHELERSLDARERLTRLLRKLLAFKHGDLYAAIPQSAQVPEKLRDTNILIHDPHYRHLRDLWNRAAGERASARLTPREQMLVEQRCLANYSSYVGLVVARALRSFGHDFASGADGGSEAVLGHTRIRVTRQGLDWHLNDGRSEIVLVPFEFAFSGAEQPAVAGATQRYAVCCFPQGTDPRDDTAHGGLSVHPADFYVEEKIRAMLTDWQLRPMFARYGTPLKNVPNAIVDFLRDHDLGRGDASQLFIVKPPANGQRAALDAVAARHANPQTRADVLQRLDDLRVLSTCRNDWCGAAMAFEPSDGGCFHAYCHRCGARTGIRLDHHRRHAFLWPDGAAQPGDTDYGARRLEFDL